MMAGFIKEKTAWFKEDWKALLGVILLGLIPFALPTQSEGAFLFSPGQALYASDQLGSPSWRFYFEALKHGIIPQWLPYELGGMPSFDAGFGDTAYPLFILLGMILPIKTLISWMFVFHVLIAGLCAYYLVRRFFRLDKLLSVALAAAYMLNTNFISHIHAGHTGKFYIMTWLPLSLYLLLRSLQREAKLRHFLGLALSVTLMMLPFHPQFLYYVLMGYFVVWAWRTFQLAKEKAYGSAVMTAARFWVPILLGLGMAFFVLYPPTQWTKFYGVRGSTEKTTYEHATSWSMHPEETASLIVPEFGGINEKYWGRNPFKLNSEYPGLSVLFLGILGLVLYRKEKGYWFWLWGSIGLLAIVFGLGAHTPLFRLFYSLVPGIKNFRAPSMMLFWLATALLVMSADALSRLTRGNLPSETRARWSKRLAQVGFGIAGVLILSGLAPSIVYGMWDGIFGGDALPNLANRAASQSAFSLGAIRAGALLGMLVFATRKWLLQKPDSLRFGLALLAVTCVDLIWVDSNFIMTYDPGRFLASEPAIDYLKADTSSFRVFDLPGAEERSVMHFHEIETVDGWTDNEYRLYREYRGGDYQQNPNFMAGLKQNPDGTVSGSVFLDMLNVKYLGYRLQGEGGLRLAPNTSVLPRAWFVPYWDTVPEAEAMERMKAPGFDPRKIAFLSGSGLTPRPQPEAAAADTGKPAAAIRLEHKDYNHSSWSVTAPSEGLLVLSELWFPHWQVQVDGKPAPLLRADFAFRGIQLPAGNHTVSLTYRSPWLRKGMAVSALCLLLLAAGAGALYWLEKRKSASAPVA
ncbi:MAG: YfhO family protein [Fibrobacteres bacterium]|nr:YfhO family protein [Fibrobacterota bacterium]